MRIYTVFILEDSFWDLSALTKILESIDNIQIIGTAETVPEAIAECTAKKPDLIIVDAKIGYDKSAGEKFVRYIRNQQPDIRILGLSYHIDLLPGLKLAGCHYVEHKALIEDREAARKFIQGALTPKPVKYR
jgi:ActR/RegA family two-component response regulator